MTAGGRGGKGGGGEGGGYLQDRPDRDSRRRCFLEGQRKGVGAVTSAHERSCLDERAGTDAARRAGTLAARAQRLLVLDDQQEGVRRRADGLCRPNLIALRILPRLPHVVRRQCRARESPPPRRIQSAARVPTVFTGEHAGAADEKNDSSCARPSSSAAAVPRKCPRPSTSVEAASRADGDPTHPPPPSPPQSMLAGVMYGRGTAPRAWANLVRGAPATMSPRAGFRISNFQD